MPKPYPLAVECLYTDDTKTLMSKGHHDPAEFIKACEFWNGGPLTEWGGVNATAGGCSLDGAEVKQWPMTA